jgi:hypothetical protein
MSDEKPMGQVIQIDELRIRDHLGEMVRGTVEETLNAMLDAEADRHKRSRNGRMSREDTSRSGRCRPPHPVHPARVNRLHPKPKPSFVRSARVAQGGPSVPGSRLDADHPEKGGPFARRFTSYRSGIHATGGIGNETGGRLIVKQAA